MTPTTLTALRASIAHWEDVSRDPINANVGRSACALCMMFNNPREDRHRLNGSECAGCPVYDRTKERWCSETPYDAFDEANERNDEDAIRTAAVAELEFLRSLLPIA